MERKSGNKKNKNETGIQYITGKRKMVFVGVKHSPNCYFLHSDMSISQARDFLYLCTMYFVLTHIRSHYMGQGLA